jgi:hypothetical protein
VLRASSKTGEGIAELWQAVTHIPLRRQQAADGWDLVRIAQELVARRFADARAAHDLAMSRLLSQWYQGQVDEQAAAATLLGLLAAKE